MKLLCLKWLQACVAIVTVIALLMVGCGGGGGGGGDDSDNVEIKARTLTGLVMIPSSSSTAASIQENLRLAAGMIPVMGAKVWLEGHGEINPEYTDASGTFTFNGVPADEHFVVASFNLAGQLHKQRVRALVQAGAVNTTAPTLNLAESKTVLVGILRDSAGNFLPAGTEMKLWGEIFTVGSNGSFTTPSLPVSENQAQIFVKMPGAATFSSFYGPFIAGTTPAFIEQTVLPPASTNQAPSGVLVCKNTAGVETISCVTGEQMSISLAPFDPDATHLDRLNYTWSASRGTLQVAVGQKSATWTAMDSYGVATISVLITDPEGASGKVSLRMLVNINSMDDTDTTAPEVTSRTPAAGTIGVRPDSLVSVEFSEAMLASSVTASAIAVTSGGTQVSGSSALQADGKTVKWTPATSLPGNKTITVVLASTISDLYGNQIGAQSNWTFTTALIPGVTVTSLYTNDTTPEIGGTVDDPEAVVQIMVNGRTYSATLDGTAWKAQLTHVLPDGVYDVSATATNKTGISGNDSTSNELQIDTGAKTAVLSNLPAEFTSSTQATITVGGTGVTGYKYKLNAGNWSAEKPISEKIALTGLTSGTYNLLVVAVDAAGNWQTTEDATNYVWVIDTTAKVAVLSDLPQNPTNQTTTEITVGGVGVTWYRYRLDDGSWSTTNLVANKIKLISLVSGTHNIKVVGGDDIGNWQSFDEPTVFEWVIDSTVKVAVLSNKPANPTNQNSASIIVGGEGVIAYQHSLDNGASWGSVNATSTPISLNALPDGTQTLKVIGGDSVGNWQHTSNATTYIWVVDTVKPGVTLSTTASSLTNVSPIPVRIVFSEVVNGLELADLVIGNGTAGDLVQTSPGTWTVNITPTADGLVTVDLAADKVLDAAGNSNLAATQISVTYDTVKPAVTLATTAPDPTNASPIPVSIVFSKAVSGFELADLTVGNGTAANLVETSPGTWTVNITPSANGAVTVDLAADKVNDAAGNGNTAAAQFSVIYDSALPTVTLTTPSNPTNTSPIPVTVSFSKTVTGFLLADLVVVNGTAGNLIETAPGTWTVDITPTADGVVTVDLAAGMTTDAAGNGNSAAAQLSVTYDSVRPSVLLTTTVSSPTNASPIPVTVGFSEVVTGFTLSDLVVVNGTAGNLVETAPGTWSVDITPIADGMVTVNLAADMATDAAGNGNTVAVQLSVSADYTQPTVLLSTTAPDPTNTSPIPVKIEFSETVSGFTLADLSVGNGVAGNLQVDTADRIWTVDISVVGNGAVTVNLATAKAVDAAGNGNIAAAQLSVVYDSVKPAVTLTTASNPTNSSPIPITVTFSKPVTGFALLDLVVVNGTAGNLVETASGTWTVDITPTGSAISVDLAADVAADAAGNGNTAAAQLNIVYDTTAPTVGNVTSAKPNGNYTTGEVIDITVQFSETVNVTGTPRLTLETGSINRQVNYFGGGGTNTLTFRYTVQAGDASPDLDYTDENALELNGGTVKDSAGNNAVLTLATPGAANSLGANKAIVIEATTPVVSNVDSTSADGSYATGEVIDVTVQFSEAVNVTGTPQLTLETGSTDRVVNYSSGDGTNTLTFSYIVQAGDTAADLDYTGTTALALNGGTIKNTINNAAVLTLAAPGAANSLGANRAIVVDTTAATVSNVTSTQANGSYKTDDIIDISVQFSEVVNVTGTPQLTLETGSTDQVVNYSSGGGTNTLIFSYTVQTGDTSADLDYKNTAALSLNGGTINDAAGNAAVITLAVPGAASSLGANKAIVVDATAPTVSNVTSTKANGSYTTGEVISITVQFSETVNVTGTPQLTLETGTPDQVADYASGGGTNTLTFNYTVQAGDATADLDYAGTTALSGTINDAVGNSAVLTLVTPGQAGSLGANKAIVIDTTAPTVSNVTSTKADGQYTTGAAINITVQFDESVIVTGTPQLTLETGSTDRVANYSSGGGTNILTFSYTVQAGDTSADLDYTGTTALAFNGGNIKDATGNAAVLTLVAPGAGNSLGANKAIVIDTTAATVSSVTSAKPNGSYTTGEVIDITVQFSETVNVIGTPQLTLETGLIDRVVNYSSGGGTNTLTFNYTVQAGDTSADLDYKGTTALALNGGTIKDTAGNSSVLTLATPGAVNSLGANKAIVIDTAAATVSNVTSAKPDGSYTTGEVIDITVQFSEAVNVTGTPQLTLETGLTDRVVNYSGGDGTTTLTFSYTVQAGDASADLDYKGTTALALNGGTIKDTTGNAAVLTLTAPGTAGSLGSSKAIVIDANFPTVSNVTSSKTNGSYTTGEAINVTIQFSETVNVTGTPQLTLETGSTDRVVNYSGGGGTNTLTFIYTVQAGDTTIDLDYTGTIALALNGGTIADTTGNSAVLTLAAPGTAGSLGMNKAIVIDTSAPTVGNVTSTKVDGSYKAGEAFNITVQFSETVNVTGTPQLTLETGSTDRVANYSSGGGTNTLSFIYTAQTGDTSTDLDYTNTAALALNSGTIKDATGNAAVLTLAIPGAAASLGANKDIVIDTTAATVSSVTSAEPNGSYTTGEVVGITVQFTEVVNVIGTPRLTLETGSVDRVVNYSSGGGTNALTFNYTIQAGDTSADLDYLNTTALALNGGTVKDAAGNNAVLTLATPGAANSLGANKNIVIDTNAPTVVGVNSTDLDGSYKAGALINVTVQFNDVVYVTGIPQLTLETGSVDRVVNYSSGATTNTLTFSYTVQAGDTSADLDYTNTAALALNGGTIKDATGNAAILSLAAPGAANSLGANRAIVIDTTVPTVSNVSSTKLNGIYTIDEVIDITVQFNDVVNVTGGTPRITLETGVTDRVADWISGDGTNTLTFRYTVQAGDTSSSLDYTATDSLDLNGCAIKDAAGNNASLSLPVPGAANSLGANKNIAIDTAAPTAGNVTSAKANGSYSAGAVIDITVQFSEAVNVTGTPQLTLETGVTDRAADYTSGGGTNTLTFRYTVQAGDASGDLDYTNTGALALYGGTIKDATGNPAVLTLAAPGAANSLGANKAIIIDNVAPTVSNVTTTNLNDSYTTGDVIDITVQFTEIVSVTGLPQLTLETGVTDRLAYYLSGGGTNTLTFRYTVQSGDTSLDLDYTDEVALGVNAGTIKDIAGNNAVLTLATPGNAGSLGFNDDIVIDTAAPTVSNVTTTNLNGSYKAGSTIDVTVEFGELVYVTGTPRLTLETGTTDQQASYLSGGGTSILTFRYIVQAGDTSADLDYTTISALALYGGTIKDAAGNNANLILAAPGAANSLGFNAAIVIDTAVPTVINVSSTKLNGSYTIGEVIDVTVQFSEAVNVVGGTPLLTLETGAPDRVATWVGGGGTNTLTFSYTVQAGDTSSTLDYIDIDALDLNGSSIRDTAVNNAVLTLAVPGAAGSLGANKSIVIDTAAPTVVNVTSANANATYGTGAVIDITVQFSEAVNVIGIPELTLETGVSDYTADYLSGDGSTTLTFRYTVQAGDISADLDYINTGALEGGIIRDATGNNAVLTLAVPGTLGSLGFNRNFVISGT